MCEKPFMNMAGKLPHRHVIETKTEDAGRANFQMAKECYANVWLYHAIYADFAISGKLEIETLKDSRVIKL